MRKVWLDELAMVFIHHQEIELVDSNGNEWYEDLASVSKVYHAPSPKRPWMPKCGARRRRMNSQMVERQLVAQVLRPCARCYP